MSRQLVAMNTAMLVSTVVTAARPAVPTDGVDITNWRSPSPYASPLAAILVGGTLAATVASPTGGGSGVEVWGYARSAWWLIGVLNNGTAVPIVAAGQGFAQEMDVIGAFERLAVAGTASAGVVTAQIAPLDSYTS